MLHKYISPVCSQTYCNDFDLASEDLLLVPHWRALLKQGTYLGHGTFFFEKQQNVKQSVDVYLNEDKKDLKMELLSLHPSLLEWLVKQSS